MTDKKNVSGLTYRDAGVDINAGEAFWVSLNQKPGTMRKGANPELGGWRLFDLKAAGYKDPILVSGTDGVAQN